MPDSSRSHRRHHRSGSSEQTARRRVVSAGQVFRHVLLAAVYLNLMLLAHTGLIEWREDDWATLLVVASATMGGHLAYLGQKFLAWKKKQRDSRSLRAVG